MSKSTTKKAQSKPRATKKNAEVVTKQKPVEISSVNESATLEEELLKTAQAQEEELEKSGSNTNPKVNGDDTVSGNEKTVTSLEKNDGDINADGSTKAEPNVIDENQTNSNEVTTVQEPPKPLEPPVTTDKKEPKAHEDDKEKYTTYDHTVKVNGVWYNAFERVPK